MYVIDVCVGLCDCPWRKCCNCSRLSSRIFCCHVSLQDRGMYYLSFRLLYYHSLYYKVLHPSQDWLYDSTVGRILKYFISYIWGDNHRYLLAVLPKPCSWQCFRIKCANIWYVFTYMLQENFNNDQSDKAKLDSQTLGNIHWSVTETGNPASIYMPSLAYVKYIWQC